MFKCELNAEVSSIANDDKFAAPYVSMGYREAGASRWCMIVGQSIFLKAAENEFKSNYFKLDLDYLHVRRYSEAGYKMYFYT